MTAHSKVAILITTYNSSDYLAGQLDSLLIQTYQDWEAFVKDDLSTDNTLDILADYAKRDGRFHILQDKVKRGARDGFMFLLEEVEAELYMFCDHDDVWLPNKIESCVNRYSEQADKEQPLIVATDLKLVDESLNVICESFWEYKRFPQSWFNDKYYHLFYDNIPGCVMLFNRQAKEVSLPYHPDTAMHDLWVIASVLWHEGRVECIHEPHMLYRQHSHNVTGVRKTPTLMQQLGKVRSLWKKTRVQYKASLPLAKIGFVRFLLLKTYYSCRIHFLRPD